MTARQEEMRALNSFFPSKYIFFFALYKNLFYEYNFFFSNVYVNFFFFFNV
jgi:hypothetical protein